MQTSRNAAHEQRSEPRDRKRPDGCQACEEERDRERGEQQHAEEHGETTPLERLVAADADTAGVHGRRYRTRVRRALILLLATGLLAGCGGSSNGDETLTRDEYAAQADAICAKYKKQTDALARPSTLSGLADVADDVIPILEKARGELGELKPPPNAQVTAALWLDQFNVIIGDVEKIRDKAKAKDAAGVQDLAKPALEHNKRANELATQLGMKVCSED